MPILCQLADPDHYEAFDWDLRHDEDSQRYWMDLFSGYTENIRRHLLEDDLTGDMFEERWQGFLKEYQAGIETRQRDPVRHRINTIELGRFRQAIMNRYGFADPFQRIKRRENALAASLYGQVIARIDQLPADDRWEPLIQSMFAGNMFDLGSPRTIQMYREGGITYDRLLERIPARPWHIDGFEPLTARLRDRAYRQILFFADNAGLDVVLGVIPTARELARQGMPTVIAANSAPALNDITIDELVPLMQELCKQDPTLAALMKEGTLRIIASGCGIPLIDFREVSPACNAEAARSDLIVIEGMGRGVESNWRQTFKCDVWRVALVKDECVARWIGGQVFDAVCRFDPAQRAIL